MHHGFRVAQYQRPLTVIVQEQGRKRDREPSKTNGIASEMTHIRIERFRASDCQEHRSEDDETDEAVFEQKDSLVYPGVVKICSYLLLSVLITDAGSFKRR